MYIHKDFPGGNINLISISANKIQLEQEIRDTTEWWFYWSFCVENPSAGEYLFEFTNGDVIGPWGPAVSFDRITWDWSFTAASRSSFTFTFTGVESRVYFSFSLPYQLADFHRRIVGFNCQSKSPASKSRVGGRLNLLTDQSKSPASKSRVDGGLNSLTENVIISEFTISEKGRKIPLLRFGDGIRNIFFTARSHACESVANYVLEGVITSLLKSGNEKIREDYTFHVIPFLDIDGVEEGDQGKCRDPHDHNRDYTDKPIYNAISALMDYTLKYKPLLYIDFHCPGPGFHRYASGSDRDNYPHFVKSQPSVKAQIEKLGFILHEITLNNKNSNPILYTPEHDIDIGVDWLIPEEMIGSSCSFFVSQGAKLSVILEMPYFGTRDCIYTRDNTFNFGIDFGKAIMRYLS